MRARSQDTNSPAAQKLKVYDWITTEVKMMEASDLYYCRTTCIEPVSLNSDERVKVGLTCHISSVGSPEVPDTGTTPIKD